MEDDKDFKKKERVDITREVTDAITKGDFSKLNDMVKDTVKDTVEDVVEEIRRVSNRPRTNYSSSGSHTRHGAFSPNDRYTGYKGDARNGEFADFNNPQKSGNPIWDGINSGVSQPFQNRHFNVANQTPIPAKVRFVPRKHVSSMALSIVSWFFGLIFLMALAGGAFFDAYQMFPILIFTGLSGFGIYRSHRRLRNIKKAKRLYYFVRERNYITLSEIADIFHCSTQKAKKTMLGILEQGIFPEARFDASGTTLLLTRESYDNYMYIEKRKQTLQVAEDMEKQQLTDSDVAKNLTAEQKRDWLNVVNDGEGYIQKLRKLNDEIPEEVISERLDELEKLLRSIFDRVKKKPSEANQMRRFMDYYLPTTVKLVEKFKEFGNITTPGKEVLDAKSNIENTLDTINRAFVEMLNNLYKNDIYDVTADASVIKTMLAKEGLTSDFK